VEYYGELVDVFALGVVLFVMMIGYYPFDDASEFDPKYEKIASKKFSQFWGFFEVQNKKINPLFKDLI